MVLGLPVNVMSPIRGQASAQMYAQAVQQQVQELKAENFQKLHLLRLPASVMQVLLPHLSDISAKLLKQVTSLLGPVHPAAHAPAWPGSVVHAPGVECSGRFSKLCRRGALTCPLVCCSQSLVAMWPLSVSAVLSTISEPWSPPWKGHLLRC